MGKGTTKTTPHNGFNFRNWGIIIGVFICFLSILIIYISSIKSSPSVSKEESRKILKKDAYKLQYRQDTATLFSESALEWMLEQKDDFDMIYVAAENYYFRDQMEKAIEIFEYLVENYEITEQFHSVIYTKLQQYYSNHKKHGKNIEMLTHAINTRFEDGDFLEQWYIALVASYIHEERLSEANRTAITCISVTESLGNFPKSCYQQLGIIHHNILNSRFVFQFLDKSDIESFDHHFIASKLYYYLLKPYCEEQLKFWKDTNGNLCPAVSIPLVVDFGLTEENQEIKNSHLLSENVLNEIEELNEFKIPCSSQEWPKTIAEEGNHFIPLDYDITEKLLCQDDKKIIIHSFQNVTISGAQKIISKNHPNKDNKCIIYTHGFPYGNSHTIPYNYENTDFDKPIKVIENALILHYIEVNYYHFTIECISKILVSQFHSVFKNLNDFRILLSFSQFSIDLCDKLGISHLIEIYRPDEFRYHVNNAFTIDWSFRNDSKMLELHHSDDIFVPPPPILRMTAKTLLSMIPKYNEKRNLVIFQHRNRNRNLTDPTEFYELLFKISKQHGLEFKIHGYSKSTFNLEDDQILFNRAVVVMGVHGAGFTNIIYCQENTAVVEIQTYASRPMEYARMASILNFPYYVIDRVRFGFYSTKPKFSDLELNDIERTLHTILNDHGYPLLN